MIAQISLAGVIIIFSVTVDLVGSSASPIQDEII